MFTGGKEGTYYLLKAYALGSFNKDNHDGNAFQAIPSAASTGNASVSIGTGGIYSGAAYWPAGACIVVFLLCSDWEKGKLKTLTRGIPSPKATSLSSCVANLTLLHGWCGFFNCWPEDAWKACVCTFSPLLCCHKEAKTGARSGHTGALGNQHGTPPRPACLLVERCNCSHAMQGAHCTFMACVKCHCRSMSSRMMTNCGSPHHPPLPATSPSAHLYLLFPRCTALPHCYYSGKCLNIIPWYRAHLACC